MNPILRDLLGHQGWADAELWNAIGANAAAREDKIIRDRFFHLHLVQRAFLWATGDRVAKFAFSKPEDFASFDDLRGFARATADDVAGRSASLTEANLDTPVVIPWFKDPPLTLSVAEALTQMAMHSHHHRAQNSTRLRELGGEPPLMDLIVWYWKGRPAAAW